MKTVINNTSKIEQETIIVGVPEHLNQLESIRIAGNDIKDLLSPLKRTSYFQHQCWSDFEYIFKVDEKAHKLITVGLGNIKTLGYNDYLKSSEIYFKL